MTSIQPNAVLATRVYSARPDLPSNPFSNAGANGAPNGGVIGTNGQGAGQSASTPADNAAGARGAQTVQRSGVPGTTTVPAQDGSAPAPLRTPTERAPSVQVDLSDEARQFLDAGPSFSAERGTSTSGQGQVAGTASLDTLAAPEPVSTPALSLPASPEPLPAAQGQDPSQIRKPLEAGTPVATSAESAPGTGGGLGVGAREAPLAAVRSAPPAPPGSALNLSI